MTMELHLIKRGGLAPTTGKREPAASSLFKMCHTLAERQVEEKLDKTDQVAASATPVAIEQVLAGIDVEGRTAFLVQGHSPTNSCVAGTDEAVQLWLLQVLQQRNALFEPLQIACPWRCFRLQGRA